MRSSVLESAILGNRGAAPLGVRRHDRGM